MATFTHVNQRDVRYLYWSPADYSIFQHLYVTEFDFPSKRERPPEPIKSPTEGSLIKYSHSPGVIRLIGPDGQTYGSFGGGFPPIDSPITDASLHATVSGKLIDKLQEFQLNLSDYIGEHKETVGMVCQVGKLLHDAWQLRKGQIPPRWARLAKSAASRSYCMSDVSAAWVTGQFVILPQLLTINGVMQQLSGLEGKTTRIFTASATSESDYETGEDLWFAPPVGYCKTKYIVGRRDKLKASVVVEASFGAPQFTAGNIAEAAWAGLPFSFVVDWVLGVGQYLQRLNGVPNGMSIVSSWSTRSTTYSVSRQGVSEHFVDGFTYVDEGFEMEGLVVKRVPGFTIGPPPLPKWQPRRSFTVLTTAVALLFNLKTQCCSKIQPRRRYKWVTHRYQIFDPRKKGYRFITKRRRTIVLI